MNWTPISESLPPKLDYQEEYYVTVESHYGGENHGRFTSRAYYLDKQWGIHNEDGRIEYQSYGWKILAWMKTNDPEPWNG